MKIHHIQNVRANENMFDFDCGFREEVKGFGELVRNGRMIFKISRHKIFFKKCRITRLG